MTLEEKYAEPSVGSTRPPCVQWTAAFGTPWSQCRWNQPSRVSDSSILRVICARLRRSPRNRTLPSSIFGETNCPQRGQSQVAVSARSESDIASKSQGAKHTSLCDQLVICWHSAHWPITASQHREHCFCFSHEPIRESALCAQEVAKPQVKLPSDLCAERSALQEEVPYCGGTRGLCLGVVSARKQRWAMGVRVACRVCGRIRKAIRLAGCFFSFSVGFY